MSFFGISASGKRIVLLFDVSGSVVGKAERSGVPLEVIKKETQVVLTPTEFKLLQCISGHPGQVFTRLQLVNVILGYDFEGYDRTIDAHIKNIRHKIEDNQWAPSYIKTVYGVGYKFTGLPDAD